VVLSFDHRSLVVTPALDVVGVNGREGFLLLLQIVDKGIHIERGHPFPLRNIKGSTTQGARRGGGGVVSDQRIEDPQRLFNAAETEGVEAGQSARIPQPFTTNGTIVSRILLKT